MSRDPDALLAALERQLHSVKLLGDGSPRRIPATEARRLVVGRADHFHWGGTHKRVRWLKLIDTIRWQPCWRTARAAVMPPWPGWCED